MGRIQEKSKIDTLDKFPGGTRWEIPEETQDKLYRRKSERTFGKESQKKLLKITFEKHVDIIVIPLQDILGGSIGKNFRRPLKFREVHWKSHLGITIIKKLPNCNRNSENIPEKKNSFITGINFGWKYCGSLGTIFWGHPMRNTEKNLVELLRKYSDNFKLNSWEEFQEESWEEYGKNSR